MATESWTGRYWQYVSEADGNAIGDFNMIDGATGLIIERDNNNLPFSSQPRAQHGG